MNKFKIARGIVLLTASLILVSIGTSLVYAIPGSTVKVNGKLFSPIFYFDAPYAKPRYGNTIMLEVKAKWVDGSLVGSGSLHGINCHSTFFFDDLTGTFSGGVLTLTGTVTSTSTPFEWWIGTPIQLVTDLSGNNMQLTITVMDPEYGNFPIDFTGSGTVIM